MRSGAGAEVAVSGRYWGGANAQPVQRPERLEGSRFTRWQLYRSAAGGSRERPNAMFCPSPLFRAGDPTAHRTAAPRNVPGSRLLLTYRTAMLSRGRGTAPLQALGMRRRV